MKKRVLISIAALSLMMISAQAEGMRCAGGKCGAGMTKPIKQNGMMHKAKKMHKKGMNSPFLIKHGLPHYTKMLMKNWNDSQLNLTAEQKAKLLEVRKATMGSIKRLKPAVTRLRKEIVQAAKNGAKAAALKAKVEKLASLEAEATMTHLKCIEDTKAILSPAQIQYLQQKRKAHRMKMKQMKQGGMKCSGGKCGSK
jgi:Spy/CpxP family protein refolding chaperone